MKYARCFDNDFLLSPGSPFSSNRLLINISSFQCKTTWYYTAYLNECWCTDRPKVLGIIAEGRSWERTSSAAIAETTGGGAGCRKEQVWRVVILLEAERGQIMLCEISAIQCDLLLMYYYSKRSRIKSFPWSTWPINPKVIVWPVQESPKMFVMTISISNIIDNSKMDLLTLRVSDNVQKQYRK